MSEFVYWIGGVCVCGYVCVIDDQNEKFFQSNANFQATTKY